MGGIVLELTENVFGRVLRGLLRETPTRGEQTQPGSDGGAMDQSSIARTSIRLTRTSRLRRPRHGKVAEQRLGAVWSAE